MKPVYTSTSYLDRQYTIDGEKSEVNRKRRKESVDCREDKFQALSSRSRSKDRRVKDEKGENIRMSANDKVSANKKKRKGSKEKSLKRKVKEAEFTDEEIAEILNSQDILIDEIKKDIEKYSKNFKKVGLNEILEKKIQLTAEVDSLKSEIALIRKGVQNSQTKHEKESKGLEKLVRGISKHLSNYSSLTEKAKKSLESIRSEYEGLLEKEKNTDEEFKQTSSKNAEREHDYLNFITGVDELKENDRLNIKINNTRSEIKEEKLRSHQLRDRLESSQQEKSSLEEKIASLNQEVKEVVIYYLNSTLEVCIF